MNSKEVRTKYAKQFNILEKPGNLKACLILTLYVFQILMSIFAGLFLLEGSNPYGILLIILIIVFIATRFRGLNNIVHECSHFSYAKKNSLTCYSAEFLLR